MFPLSSLLFTDLYELTMAQAFHQEGMEGQAVFELFFREMPAARNYIVAAGLADVLDAVERLKASDADLQYLRSHGSFGEDFLNRLADFRFTGDIYAVAEGTPVFPNEPLLQVVAPIFQAQIIETLLLNQIHFQTVAASKAARIVHAARGRAVVDFGSRRAHGADAALKVARCSYLVGAAGTSNVLAGRLYDVPIFGTMAHSYIQAHDDESAAFQRFAQRYPGTTLLVDTYDTIQGVKKLIELQKRLKSRFQFRAIRLDSGNLDDLARKSRRMLDEADLEAVEIFASSELDEYRIQGLLDAGAPIDGFGVGTRLAVSPDATDLDMAYKLVEYAGVPRIKLSSHKVIYPGRKQVFRFEEGGRMTHDLIGRADEQAGGQPLLQLVVQGGKRLPAGSVGLKDARQHSLQQLEKLPESIRRLEKSPEPYPVQISRALQLDLQKMRRSLRP